MKYLGLFSLLLFFISCESKKEKQAAEFTTYFEEHNGNQTPSYGEVIDFYMELARNFPSINIQTIGNTDSGNPLHLVTYNRDGDFNFNRLRENKVIVLINNGIHPGETDGIDASMLLFRNLSAGELEFSEDVIITTIPVYNIGGSLNRNSTTRVNQNGPDAYGFRGNARNFDLNRDFIKSDTKNAKTFAEIFHLLDPPILIDTHVSNGADYQYVLTHLFTQHNKLGGELGNFLEEELRPQFEQALDEAGWDITPYVNVYGKPPDRGFDQFMDHPRYSTGYAALWQTIGLMIETHMLKPYSDRVAGTLAALEQMISVVDSNSEAISKARDNDREMYRNLSHYPLKWELDTTVVSTISFKGYEADTTLSELTGLPRLQYNRSNPFEKDIPYRNSYSPSDSVNVPKAYIIPKSWQDAVDHFRSNGIEIAEVESDTILEVTVYRIESYQTSPRPYEGHYPHYQTKVSATKENVAINEGDYYILTAQDGIRYILETLEPEAVDSFFNWNFFDPILQQKEGFSPYVFEDLALDFLNKNDSLRLEFNNLKEKDEAFRNNAFLQLDWIYKRSPYYEKAHLRYPVYRVEN